MPASFPVTTAESVVAVTEAVSVAGRSVDTAYVSDFTGLSATRVDAAIGLATEIGLLRAPAVGSYVIDNTISRYLVTSNEVVRAAVIRVVLESYAPFVTFRNRIRDTNDVDRAAHQVQVLLGLAGTKEDIKETLINLGTFSQALQSLGGGRYAASDAPLANALQTLAAAAVDEVRAEAHVRETLGDEAASYVSRDDVLVELGTALKNANEGGSRTAVVCAGNAVESFLAQVGKDAGVNLAGKNGINAKAIELKNKGALPKKLEGVASYLGSVRNGADHGADPETGKPWDITPETGIQYPYVACSFVRSVVRFRGGGKCEL